MTKLTATLLTFILLIQTAPAVSAKPKGDWETVKALEHRSIAVRTRDGAMHFGLLQVADDNAILIRIAGEDDFTAQEINLRRDEVAKVWRAKLRFGETNIAKGAWIGVGAGVSVGLIQALVLASRHDADPPAGGGLFIIAGAGAGALLGSFWKKKHKKQELIYSND